MYVSPIRVRQCQVKVVHFGHSACVLNPIYSSWLYVHTHVQIQYALSYNLMFIVHSRFDIQRSVLFTRDMFLFLRGISCNFSIVFFDTVKQIYDSITLITRNLDIGIISEFDIK